MLMSDNPKDPKKPIKGKDNIIIFPKIPIRRNPPSQEDEKRQEQIRVQHNKIFVQAISEEITQIVLLRMKDENFNLTAPTFLKDYKLFSEALKSMILRQVKINHPLQPRVDRSVTTKGQGKDLYSITIDYDKF